MREIVGQGDKVPFGVRAIERGYHVEGVWNSKATTPLQTPPSSKPSSPVLRGKRIVKKNKRETIESNTSSPDIPELALIAPCPMDTTAGLVSESLAQFGTTDHTRFAANQPITDCRMAPRAQMAHRIDQWKDRGLNIPTALHVSAPFREGSQRCRVRLSSGE